MCQPLVFVPGEETEQLLPPSWSPQADGELDTTSLALFWQRAQGAQLPAPLSAGASVLAGLQRGEVFLQNPGAEFGGCGKGEGGGT